MLLYLGVWNLGARAVVLAVPGDNARQAAQFVQMRSCGAL